MKMWGLDDSNTCFEKQNFWHKCSSQEIINNIIINDWLSELVDSCQCMSLHVLSISLSFKQIFERCLIAHRNGFVGLRQSVCLTDEAYTTADDHWRPCFTNTHRHTQGTWWWYNCVVQPLRSRHRSLHTCVIFFNIVSTHQHFCHRSSSMCTMSLAESCDLTFLFQRQ